jgi:hypothetical protein
MTTENRSTWIKTVHFVHQELHVDWCGAVMMQEQQNNKKFHRIKPTNALLLQLCCLHTICQNSDMFRSILIIFRKLLNIKKHTHRSKHMEVMTNFV